MTDRSVGGYDHMYELAELALDGKNAYFITARGGPSGHMKLVSPNTLRVQYVGEDVVDLTRCSKDSDR
ncbi:MAG: hypothetical protein KAF27_07065 [Porphyrobacter sp.]|nr:hypothetical protein [Porphyrobacter sp.]